MSYSRMHDAGIDLPFAGCVVGKKLGSGYWGTVYLVRNTRTGEEFACKFLPRGKQIVDNCENVERELCNLRQLQGHPNIVVLKQVFLTPAHLGIAMELAAGGELHKLVVKAGRLSEDVACYFFRQLISGLAWCHRNGVCHRDLKLENSLLDRPVPPAAARDINLLLAVRPQLKICDFGYSKSSVFDSKPNSVVGTPVYIAPEVLSQPNYDGAAADVWSCGVLLYVMLVGVYPFEDPDDPKEDIRKTINRILAVDYRIPPKVQLSGQCRDLLSRIFVKDPAARITLAQIQQHPWFHTNPAAAAATAQGSMQPLADFKFLQSEADIRRMIIDAAAVDHEQEELDLLRSSGHVDGFMDKFMCGPGVFHDSRGNQASEFNMAGGRFIDPDIALELGEEYLKAHWTGNCS